MERRPVRCAIYTRQSVARPNDTDFSSCDAQREACLDLIAAHAPDGWVAIDERFDDAGESGATRSLLPVPASEKAASRRRASSFSSASLASMRARSACALACDAPSSLNSARMDREAAYFDIGYEHGRAAGRAEALAQGGPRDTAAYRTLSQRLREAAVNAGLPHERATAALLEAAWAILVVGGAPSPVTGQSKGNRR